MNCARCKVEKDISEFRIIKGRNNKPHSYCKPCEKAYKGEWKTKRRRAAGIPKKVFKTEMIVEPGIYRCRKCDAEKPESDFAPSALRPRGWGWCRSCFTKHVRPGNCSVRIATGPRARKTR